MIALCDNTGLKLGFPMTKTEYFLMVDVNPRRKQIIDEVINTLIKPKVMIPDPAVRNMQDYCKLLSKAD